MENHLGLIAKQEEGGELESNLVLSLGTTLSAKTQTGKLEDKAKNTNLYSSTKHDHETDEVDGDLSLGLEFQQTPTQNYNLNLKGPKDDAEDISHQTNLKRARVSVRVRCDTPTVS